MAREPKYAVGEHVVVSRQFNETVQGSDDSVVRAKIVEPVKDQHSQEFNGVYRIEICDEEKPFNLIFEEAIIPMH